MIDHLVVAQMLVDPLDRTRVVQGVWVIDGVGIIGVKVGVQAPVLAIGKRVTLVYLYVRPFLGLILIDRVPLVEGRLPILEADQPGRDLRVMILNRFIRSFIVSFCSKFGQSLHVS